MVKAESGEADEGGEDCAHDESPGERDAEHNSDGGRQRLRDGDG